MGVHGAYMKGCDLNQWVQAYGFVQEWFENHNQYMAFLVSLLQMVWCMVMSVLFLQLHKSKYFFLQEDGGDVQRSPCL